MRQRPPSGWNCAAGWTKTTRAATSTSNTPDSPPAPEPGAPNPRAAPTPGPQALAFFCMTAKLNMAGTIWAPISAQPLKPTLRPSGHRKFRSGGAHVHFFEDPPAPASVITKQPPSLARLAAVLGMASTVAVAAEPVGETRMDVGDTPQLRQMVRPHQVVCGSVPDNATLCMPSTQSRRAGSRAWNVNATSTSVTGLLVPLVLDPGSSKLLLRRRQRQRECKMTQRINQPRALNH
jgi:hypothetical protein